MMTAESVQFEGRLSALTTAKFLDYMLVEHTAIVVGKRATVEQECMGLLFLVHLSSSTH